MDVSIVQTPGGHGLNNLCLGFFLRGQPATAGHVKEIGVATGIELVGPFK